MAIAKGLFTDFNHIHSSADENEPCYQPGISLEKSWVIARYHKVAIFSCVFDVINIKISVVYPVKMMTAISIAVGIYGDNNVFLGLLTAIVECDAIHL